jgi:hypothetical protein
MNDLATHRCAGRGPAGRALLVAVSLLALAAALGCSGGGEEQGDGGAQTGGSSVWDQMTWDQDDWG